MGINHSKPVTAAVLSLLSGVFILGIGLTLLTLSMIPGSLSYLGLLEGMIICALALLLLVYPRMSVILGAFIIILSIISIFGAFGGLIIGTLLGMLGGTLAVAWKGPVEIEGKAIAQEGDTAIKILSSSEEEKSVLDG